MRWSRNLTLVAVVLASFHLLSSSLQAATVTKATEAAWANELQRAKQILLTSARDDNRFLPAVEAVRSSQPVILALQSPCGKGVSVPNGLVHHWTGTVLIPGASAGDLLAVLKDFDHYRDTFSPAVVESSLLQQKGDEYEYRLRLLQRGFGVKAGMTARFRTTFVAINSKSGYSMTEALELHELKDYDSPATEVLPLEDAHGYLERSATLVRYRELADGIEVQLETLSLSRDVPAAIRWLANPLIRRFASETMATTLNRLSTGVLKAADTGSLRASNTQSHQSSR